MSELTLEQQERRIMLVLIYAHYEHNDELYDEKCRELERFYFDNGREDLADWVIAQRVPSLAWVPMEVDV